MQLCIRASCLPTCTDAPPAPCVASTAPAPAPAAPPAAPTAPTVNRPRLLPATTLPPGPPPPLAACSSPPPAALPFRALPLMAPAPCRPPPAPAVPLRCTPSGFVSVSRSGCCCCCSGVAGLMPAVKKNSKSCARECMAGMRHARCSLGDRHTCCKGAAWVAYNGQGHSLPFTHAYL